jgi:hypothetical protein
MTQSSAGNNRRARGAKKLDRYGGVVFVGHKGEVGLSLVGVLSVVVGKKNRGHRSVLDKWSMASKK